MTISYQSINSENKESLIKGCLNLVKKIAWHYHGRVKNIIEIDDIIQIGMLGLVTAADNFIEKPGVTFSSYARIRIKGEIVDFLRKNSNLCRSTIVNKQKFDKSFEKLQKNFNRDPHDNELIQDLNININELHKWKEAFAANKLEAPPGAGTSSMLPGISTRPLAERPFLLKHPACIKLSLLN